MLKMGLELSRPAGSSRPETPQEAAAAKASAVETLPAVAEKEQQLLSSTIPIRGSRGRRRVYPAQTMERICTQMRPAQGRPAAVAEKAIVAAGPEGRHGQKKQSMKMNKRRRSAGEGEEKRKRTRGEGQKNKRKRKRKRRRSRSRKTKGPQEKTRGTAASASARTSTTTAVAELSLLPTARTALMKKRRFIRLGTLASFMAVTCVTSG